MRLEESSEACVPGWGKRRGRAVGERGAREGLSGAEHACLHAYAMHREEARVLPAFVARHPAACAPCLRVQNFSHQ